MHCLWKTYWLNIENGFRTTDGPAVVRINLFVRSIATISDIKMVSWQAANDRAQIFKPFIYSPICKTYVGLALSLYFLHKNNIKLATVFDYFEMSSKLNNQFVADLFHREIIYLKSIWIEKFLVVLIPWNLSFHSYSI